MAKISRIDYLESVGDWEYAVVTLDDGTFGAAWIGRGPIEGTDGELVAPVDGAGDETGVTLFETEGAARRYAEYI